MYGYILSRNSYNVMVRLYVSDVKECMPYRVAYGKRTTVKGMTRTDEKRVVLKATGRSELGWTGMKPATESTTGTTPIMATTMATTMAPKAKRTEA